MIKQMVYNNVLVRGYAFAATFTAVLGVMAVALLSGCAQPVELLWKQDLGAASQSNPLVTDDFIAVGTEHGFIITELSGKRRCSFDAHGEVVSAAATDGTLIYFGSTNYMVYAIDPQCQQVWRFATNDRIKSDPLLNNNRLYVSSYDGHLYALNAKTGTELWRFPKMVIAHLPVDTETAETGSEDKVQSVNAGVQDEQDRAATLPPQISPQIRVKPGSFSYSSPVLHQGVIYLGNLDGYLYAINTKEGSLAWRFKTRAPITSTPLIEGDIAYFGSNEGAMYALDITKPKRLWMWKAKDWINSSATMAKEIIYIGSNDKTLYAINAANGVGVWNVSLDGPVVSRPRVYKNLVLVPGGSGDNTIHLLNAKNGKEFWRYKTDGKIESDITVVANTFYVSGMDGFLYHFKINKTPAIN